MLVNLLIKILEERIQIWDGIETWDIKVLIYI